jgi:predicted RNase H-like HicB family nuclease
MKNVFNVIIEKDSEGYLVGSVPELHGCYTQGLTMNELMERVQEAISVCLEQYGDDSFGAREFVGVQRVTVAPWSAPHV